MGERVLVPGRLMGPPSGEGGESVSFQADGNARLLAFMRLPKTALSGALTRAEMREKLDGYFRNPAIDVPIKEGINGILDLFFKPPCAMCGDTGSVVVEKVTDLNDPEYGREYRDACPDCGEEVKHG